VWTGRLDDACVTKMVTSSDVSVTSVVYSSRHCSCTRREGGGWHSGLFNVLLMVPRLVGRVVALAARTGFTPGYTLTKHHHHHRRQSYTQKTSTQGGSQSNSGRGVLAGGSDLGSTFQLAFPPRYNKLRENQLTVIHPQCIRSHSSQDRPVLASIGAKS